MGAGFKKFPFNWRARIFKELKGIRLAVWMYHYLRSGKDDTVETSLGQLEADLPYSKSRIVKARGELRKAGWLVVVEETHRNEKGWWTVPTFKAVVPDSAEGAMDTVPQKALPNHSAKGVNRTVARKAATAKGATTVDTRIPVDTRDSDPTGLRVDTPSVESVSQPADGASLLGWSAAPDDTKASESLAIALCQVLSIEHRPSYTEAILPLLGCIPAQELLAVIDSKTIRSKFWLRDLSSVKQFVWRIQSEGEDSLRAQVRQEQNIDRELRRTELARKWKKWERAGFKESSEYTVGTRDACFLLADFWFNYGFHTSTVFPAEDIFIPFAAATRVLNLQEFKETITWGWHNEYREWIKEHLLATPEGFIEHYSGLYEEYRKANPFEDVEEYCDVKTIEVDEL